MVDKNTFCVAPWFSLYVDADKTIAPCCVSQGFGSHTYNQVNKYFHSDELEALRKDLLNGVRNNNCSTCWKHEDSGGDSLRLISNRTIGLFGDSSLSTQLNQPKISNLKSFDLVLGNLCNLKCVMCSPRLSSQLLAEVNLNQELKSVYGVEYKQKDFDWPKGDDFVEWCNTHLPGAVHIKFTGGEPFIIPWIGDVIEKIPDQQKKNCVLHFSTNLTTINPDLFTKFKKLKQVWLSVSVEGIGKTHEYLRFGHSWKKLSENIDAIKKMQIDNIVLSISHVLQAPSYHSIIEMTEFFDGQNILIRPIMLESPEYFHINALTKNSKQKFMEQTQGYKGFNKNFIEYVRNMSIESIEQDTDLTHQLIAHLSKFDKIRKNDYSKIIPIANLV